MKKNVKVSIIIPVYNGMSFLDKCIDSVVNQTYKNIEIILSNDGSKDGSLKKMKEFKKKYKNIIIESHNNVGLSETRNLALKKATGEYITYLDVDDYLDYDFVEKMMSYNNEHDIIIGGYRSVYSDGRINFEYFTSDTEWNRYRRVTVWARIYRLKFLKDNKIEFPHDRLYGEDVVYTMRCLSKTDKVYITKYIGYNNLINEKSITHKNKYLIKSEVPKMMKYIDEYISNDFDFLTKKNKNVRYYYLKIFTAYLVEQSHFLNYKELLEYYNESFSILKSIFKKYGYKVNCKSMVDEPKKVNLMIKLVIFFDRIKMKKLLLKFLYRKFYNK